LLERERLRRRALVGRSPVRRRHRLGQGDRGRGGRDRVVRRRVVDLRRRTGPGHRALLVRIVPRAGTEAKTEAKTEVKDRGDTEGNRDEEAWGRIPRP